MKTKVEGRMKNIGKEKLITKIQERTGKKKVEIREFIDALGDVIFDEIKKGNKVPLAHIGVMYLEKKENSCLRTFNGKFHFNKYCKPTINWGVNVRKMARDQWDIKEVESCD